MCRDGSRTMSVAEPTGDVVSVVWLLLLVFWDFLLLHALRLFFFCCLTVASLSLFSCRTKITTEWIDDNCGRLQGYKLKTLIAKDVGNLWHNGKTGAVNWWVNAETKVFQFVEPKGDGVLVVKTKLEWIEDKLGPLQNQRLKTLIAEKLAEDEPVVEDTKEAEDESVEGKLAAADLGHLWKDINFRFEGDL